MKFKIFSRAQQMKRTSIFLSLIMMISLFTGFMPTAYADTAEVTMSLSDGQGFYVMPKAFEVYEITEYYAEICPVTEYDSGEFTILEVTVIDWQGEGTEENPYLLGSQADLELLRARVAGEDNFTVDKFFELTGNIELDGNWEPIGMVGGAANRAFLGTFDGNGHQLTFAYGSKPLFGAASPSVVKNLNIKGEYISSNGLFDGFSSASSSKEISIDNVTIKSGTTIKKSGFLGEPGTQYGIYTTAVNVNINNCTIESNVKIGYDAEANAAYDNSDYQSGANGGVGPGVGSFISGLSGTITNSKSSATVYGQGNIGGIAGYKAQTMRACVIRNSVFDGEIIATGDFVGGIIGGGYNHTSSVNPPGVTIENCYSAGTISGADKVGGIFGGEGGQKQGWDNGVGYIRNNHFAGTITASGDNTGGIVGYMYSLNKNNVISNNYYLDTCGALKGIGGAKYVDTNFTVPTAVSGITYYNSEGVVPDIESGISKKDQNRTDDPFGADKDNLAKAVTAVAMRDGTVTTLLNAEGTQVWMQGTDYPVFLYNIDVYLTLLGDTDHGDIGDIHTLQNGKLTEWIAKTAYTVTGNSTVLDLLEAALTEAGLTWKNPSGEYITEITKDGVTLDSYTNGAKSGWMYTLNGKYPAAGISYQTLNDKDEIIFHYTDDYTQEDNYEVRLRDIDVSDGLLNSVYVSMGWYDTAVLIAASYSGGKLIDLQEIPVSKSGTVPINMAIEGHIRLMLWDNALGALCGAQTVKQETIDGGSCNEEDSIFGIFNGTESTIGICRR